MIFRVACVLSTSLMAIARLGSAEISCDLSGLTVGEGSYAFGASVEIVADCVGRDGRRLASLGGDYLVMQAREIAGSKVSPGRPITVLVFGGGLEPLRGGIRYRMRGQLRDGVSFGGGL